jgi:hypothetical protein
MINYYNKYVILNTKSLGLSLIHAENNRGWPDQGLRGN